MMIAPDRLEELFDRADRVLARLENLLPGTQPPPDWNAAVAFRWRKRGTQGWLQPVTKPHPIRLADIETVDGFNQAFIMFNTKQKPFDNVKVRQAINYAINKEALAKVEAALAAAGASATYVIERLA